VLVPPNPVDVPEFAIVQPDGIEIVSPDCPIVIVPEPVLVVIVPTFNIPSAIIYPM
jgi:hypothetical protein